MQDIESVIHNREDRGHRIISVSIWKKYPYAYSDLRIRRKIAKNTLRNKDVIILDQRPQWMGKRKKLYTIDEVTFGLVSPGEEYDLLCFSNSWKYDAPLLISVVNVRKEYVADALCGMGLCRDVARLAGAYCCKK